MCVRLLRFILLLLQVINQKTEQSLENEFTEQMFRGSRRKVCETHVQGPLVHFIFHVSVGIDIQTFVTELTIFNYLNIFSYVYS